MSSTLLLRRKFKLGYKTWSSYVWNKAGVAMYFHFPPKYQENLSWNSSTCCGNPDSMRNQLWSSAVSGWGFSDLGDWKLPAVTETGAGWSCFSQSRAGHLDIFLLGKEMSLPPPEYLNNTEILTPSMAGKPSWMLVLFLKTSYTLSFCQETHQMSTSISKGNKYPQA